jgi:hypothetical protein
LEVLAGDIPELRAVVLRLTAAFAATAQNLAVCILKRQRPAPPAAMEEDRTFDGDFYNDGGADESSEVQSHPTG